MAEATAADTVEVVMVEDVIEVVITTEEAEVDIIKEVVGDTEEAEVATTTIVEWVEITNMEVGSTEAIQTTGLMLLQCMDQCMITR